MSASAADPRAFADELDRALDRHVLTPRFPAAVDTERFGFRSKYDADWEPQAETHRPLVYHARLTWTAAFVAAQRPELAPRLLAAVRHGFAGLAERFWDRRHGGFQFRLDLDGAPDPQWTAKALYAQAFGLLAAARVARTAATARELEDQRAAALALAGDAFEWIESRLRGGPERPGYRTAVAADGAPLPAADGPAPAAIGVFPPADWHDQNSHLHLLEAYTELHRVAPSPAVAGRLAALVALVLERFFAEPGCLHLVLDPRGRPIPGPVSFGHDVEAAFLLLDAADALADAAVQAAALAAARRLFDHALHFGWDPHVGAWTERGGACERSRDLRCGWWVPLEAMNAASALGERLPAAERAPLERSVADSWRFLVERLIDHERGGLWLGFDDRGELLRIKSEAWFATYHAARCLVLTADRLRAAAR